MNAPRFAARPSILFAPLAAAALRAVASLVVLIAFAGALGCATTHEVKVDSLAKPEAAAAAVSYRLENRDPLRDDDSLRYKEAARYVKTALAGKGMFEAPPGTTPDLVIALDFGMSAPETRREMVSEPRYLWVPGQTRYETVQVGTNRNGEPIYRTMVVQDPPQEVFAGYEDRLVSRTIYEKHLHLTARENKPVEEGRPPAEIWTIDATSEGENRDFRKTLPILVAASIGYIGADSKGQQTVRVKDNDRGVAFVKQP